LLLLIKYTLGVFFRSDVYDEETSLPLMSYTRPSAIHVEWEIDPLTGKIVEKAGVTVNVSIPKPASKARPAFAS
jgi:hypothetical protein